MNLDFINMTSARTRPVYGCIGGMITMPREPDAKPGQNYPIRRTEYRKWRRRYSALDGMDEKLPFIHGDIGVFLFNGPT